jgi:hypothetical protein
MTKELTQALTLLRTITSADDMRWLYTYTGIALGNRPNLRGIKFSEDAPNEPTKQVARSASALIADELQTFNLVTELLYEALRPKTDAARGLVQIKNCCETIP